MKAERPRATAAIAARPPCDLRPLGPAGAAPLLEEAAAQRRNGQLHVEGPWGLAAELIVRHGRPVDATSGRLRGEAALNRIFLWSEARYRWLAPEQAAPRAIRVTIESDPSSLITEGLRQRAVWQRMLHELPPLAARFEVDFGPAARQLADLPAATQALCRLCDGRRSLGEVLRDSELPDLETLSTLGHLIGVGVLVPVPEGARARRDRSAAHLSAIGGTSDHGPTGFFPGVPAARPAPWRLMLLGLFIGVAVAVTASRAPRSQTQQVGPNQAIRSNPPAVPLPEPRLIIRSVNEPPLDVTPPSPPALAPPPPSVSAEPAATESAATDRLATACSQARSLNDPGRILAACSRVIAAGGGRPDLLALLARLELERGGYVRAAARARRAIALDPKLAEAYAYLGFAEAEAGRRREAMAAYRRYLALAPRGSYADDVRAIVRAEGGEKP